ncbi:MAG: response regulator transcription factor [Sedimentisphaerales bacterium]|nr:response regulator transcription factor [Sedimentisphaerales bacterium]
MESMVYILDDDEAVRRAISSLLKTVGLASQSFASPQEFFEAYRDEGPACLILDIRMPEMSGMDVQARLRDAGNHIPIIFITGHGDISLSVKAMKAGAADFLEKPFRDEDLLNAVRKALGQDHQRREKLAENNEIIERFNSLTQRERQIMQMVVNGYPNKNIAAKLDISEKTVEFHRAHVMQKMKVESLADLVSLAVRAELELGNVPG